MKKYIALVLTPCLLSSLTVFADPPSSQNQLSRESTSELARRLAVALGEVAGKCALGTLGVGANAIGNTLPLVTLLTTVSDDLSGNEAQLERVRAYQQASVDQPAANGFGPTFGGVLGLGFDLAYSGLVMAIDAPGRGYRFLREEVFHRPPADAPETRSVLDQLHSREAHFNNNFSVTRAAYATTAVLADEVNQECRRLASRASDLVRELRNRRERGRVPAVQGRSGSTPIASNRATVPSRETPSATSPDTHSPVVQAGSASH